MIDIAHIYRCEINQKSDTTMQIWFNEIRLRKYLSAFPGRSSLLRVESLQPRPVLLWGQPLLPLCLWAVVLLVSSVVVDCEDISIIKFVKVFTLDLTVFRVTLISVSGRSLCKTIRLRQ